MASPKQTWQQIFLESKRFNMQIETEKIKFKIQNFPIIFRQELSELQQQYLVQLQAESTIKELIENGLKNGWLVNFVELYKLLQVLVDAKLVENKSFYDYFSVLKVSSESSKSSKSADAPRARYRVKAS